jgi:hypothetical protein
LIFTHIGSLGKSAHYGTAPKQFTGEDMVALLDRNGVDVAVANLLGRLLTKEDFYGKK